MCKLRKIFGMFFAVLAVVINYSNPVTTYSKLPNEIVVQRGEELDIDFGLPVKYAIDGDYDVTIESNIDNIIMGNTLNASIVSNSLDTSNVTISAFGIFPSKRLNIVTIEDNQVLLGGQSIGIIMQCDGVLVVGYSEIVLDDATTAIPAKESGILVGDFITHVGDREVDSAAHLGNLIRTSDGDELSITLHRNSTTKTVTLTAQRDRQDEQYHMGIWGRDSSSGIGTLTYIDPDTRKFGALGHSISDVDAGVILKIRNGEIYSSKIAEIFKGVPGMPGELRGEFVLEIDQIGTIRENTRFGLFGQVQSDSALEESQLIDVAQNNEVIEGEATIYTCIDNEGVKPYTCTLSKVDYTSVNTNKNFIVSITDPDLISATGGIVQGMSGSPIVQNGKLVGAVTHVFVNNPSIGHGVFISTMMRQ